MDWCSRTEEGCWDCWEGCRDSANKDTLRKWLERLQRLSQRIETWLWHCHHCSCCDCSCYYQWKSIQEGIWRLSHLLIHSFPIGCFLRCRTRITARCSGREFLWKSRKHADSLMETESRQGGWRWLMALAHDLMRWSDHYCALLLCIIVHIQLFLIITCNLCEVRNWKSRKSTAYQPSYQVSKGFAFEK